MTPYYQDAAATLYQGDALTVLRELPTASAQTCITSPPYWGLRDYGTATWEGGDVRCDHRAGGERRQLAHGDGRVNDSYKDARHLLPGVGALFKAKCGKCGARRIDVQLGLEKTPEEYVASMVAVFREVKRVLRDDGTLWLNLGDSYASGDRSTYRSGVSDNKGQRVQDDMARPKTPPGLKAKDLIGIPWRVAFALQADGWYLRSDIIWAKPNPMPESVTDRPTKAHEYLFLLAKREKYFYDAEAIKEPAQDWSRGGPGTGILPTTHYHPLNGGNEGLASFAAKYKTGEASLFRNRRTVWEIATQTYSGAHFATFPADLVRPCVLAATSERGACAKCGAPWKRVLERLPAPHDGTSATAYAAMPNSAEHRLSLARQAQRERGHEPVLGATTIRWSPTCVCKEAETVPCVVLDPFAGSGTTCYVAKELGRRAVGIDLSAAYLDMAARRLPQGVLQL